VEVFKDRALGLPPLNTTLAQTHDRTHEIIFKALKGMRGRPPVDIAALEQLMVHFSQLVAEQPWIKELDINPLLASHESLLALDARVLIHEAKDESGLPRLAIRPYPSQYVAPWTMKDGTEVVIRPISAEDEMLMHGFHESLSDKTVYLRYLSPMLLSMRTTHERLARMTHNDYDREIALVVESQDEQGEKAILGVARLSKLRGTDEEGPLHHADQ
jgi:acetyltransferase